MRVDTSQSTLSQAFDATGAVAAGRTAADDRQTKDFQRAMTEARTVVRGSGAGFRAEAAESNGTRRSVWSAAARSDLEPSVPDPGTDSAATTPATSEEADETPAVSPLLGWVQEAIAATESAARLQQTKAADTLPVAAADETAAEVAAAAADATLAAAGAVVSGSSTTELDPTPAAPWPMTLVTPSTPPALAGDSKTALSGALTDAGIDPSTVKVSYWEELVWFPGGNWINRSITVETPNGQKMDFDAAATLRSPAVTAASVQGMMNV